MDFRYVALIALFVVLTPLSTAVFPTGELYGDLSRLQRTLQEPRQPRSSSP